MHSVEEKVTNIKTTWEIILFEIPSKSYSSTGRVGDVGRECP